MESFRFPSLNSGDTFQPWHNFDLLIYTDMGYVMDSVLLED